MIERACELDEAFFGSCAPEVLDAWLGLFEAEAAR